MISIPGSSGEKGERGDPGIDVRDYLLGGYPFYIILFQKCHSFTICRIYFYSVPNFVHS